MEPLTIAGGIAGLFSTGVGLGLGLRLIPLGLAARRDLRRLEAGPSHHSHDHPQHSRAGNRQLLKPPGRRRTSSIVGIYEGALRHAGGGYTRLYKMPLAETMLAPDESADDRVDSFAAMLGADVPEKTIVRTRYTVAPDPGAAIAEHLRARGYAGVYLPAARLHDLNLDYHRSLCASGSLRREQALMEIQVPATHEDDHSQTGIGAFVPAMLGDLRRHPLRELGPLVGYHWAGTRDDGVVRRMKGTEREIFEKRERIFRLLEMYSPLRLQRLDSEALWSAVYLSHMLGAPGVPTLPARVGFDVRDLLCSETIEDHDWYVMHGHTPVAVISVTTPGEEIITAGAMRELTAHPELTFRHTIITEFIKLGRKEAIDGLKRRERQVERTGNRADGSKKLDEEAQAALDNIASVRRQVARSHEAMVQMRCYAVVYGDPARTLSERKASEKRLDAHADLLVMALKGIDGVDAAREEPAALHCLYPQTLIGEASPEPNGREHIEVAKSLAAFIPAERAWRGSARPHTLLTTRNARLVGLNLYDKSSRSKIKSPVVTVIGEPGSGKTNAGARIINDCLASVPNLRVYAIDVGASLATHAATIGARYVRFDPEQERSINIWDYPELYESGNGKIDIRQVALIAMDAASLAAVKAEDEDAENVLTKAVTEVLKNYVKRNGRGRPRKEPTHTDLVGMLESYEYGAEHLNARARSLALKLERYLGNPFVDAPTHESFQTDSPYTIFEMESLDGFPPDLKRTLTNRVAARAVRAIGQLRPDGTRTPTLLVFDECHKYEEHYPGLKEVIARGARQGRKHNVVSMLLTHTYSDFKGMNNITATAGVKLIGKQTGEFADLVSDAKLSERTVGAINAIQNADGIYTEWVLVLGSRNHQQVEMVRFNLSPPELWTFTTNPEEQDARVRVANLQPHWSPGEVIAWLAREYPRGLVSQGLVDIDERRLPRS